MARLSRGLPGAGEEGEGVRQDAADVVPVVAARPYVQDGGDTRVVQELLEALRLTLDHRVGLARRGGEEDPYVPGGAEVVVRAVGGGRASSGTEQGGWGVNGSSSAPKMGEGSDTWK